MVGVYSQSLRKLWKEWNVRTLVLVSLTFQVVLICFGSRRKYDPKLWIRIVVWCAYLAADSVATLALGAISSELVDVYDNSGKVNPDVELNAFWAPFLLLHLGGPDTITAYALEDNELWLRNLLGLFSQTGVALFVFPLAWTGSRLSVLAILMILVGLIKYGERTWVLWRASSEQLEKFPSYKVRQELLHRNILSLVKAPSLGSQESIIYVAYRLIVFYMPCIVHARRGDYMYEAVSSVMAEIPAKNISKLIEVELGFMYDLLFTKARVVYTPCGLALRIISFFLTCAVLVLFSIGVTQKNSYSKVDVAITFVLLVGAITIDLYAAFALLSSNWTTALLYSRTQENSCCQAIAYCQKYLNKSPLWSNSISQFSLLRFCFGEKHVRFGCVLKYFDRVHKKLEQRGSITYTEVTDALREQIIRKVKQKENEPRDQIQGVLVEELNPYKGRDIKQNIIVWHIATELCYYLEEDAEAAANVQSEQREIILHISQYLLSLLVLYPSMLSAEVNADLFEKTCGFASDIYKEMSRAGFKDISLPIRKSKSESDDFRKLYHGLRSYDQPIENPADCFTEGGNLIPAAVWLSLKLDEISNKQMKWKIISDVLLERLLYVASQWKGNEHAQQLRRGGELLTHVWLLMLYLTVV
ncbi:uncharacterized protein LOC120012666 [Tripterygium wilfordii]|uniref:uncharacterized protein LOC120012666 n=1 Tax=Tripterygium wilfordii TaxID=458696 RepID=UPI0018F835FC|nr:uncharacterized protein LOC120012666 [Tripterygium wilfordii]